MNEQLYIQINDHLWIFNNRNKSLFVLMRKKTAYNADYYYEFGEIIFNAPVLTSYRPYNVMIFKTLEDADRQHIRGMSLYNITIVQDDQAVFDIFDRHIRYLCNIETEEDAAIMRNYNEIKSDNHYHSLLGNSIWFYMYRSHNLMFMVRKKFPSGNDYYEICDFICDENIASSIARVAGRTCADISEDDDKFLSEFYAFGNAKFKSEYCRPKDANDVMKKCFDDYITSVLYLMCDYDSLK